MHPILIEFPNGFFIGTYGVLIALGLVAAVLLAAWQGRRYGIPAEHFQDLTFIAVLSGFLGGRLLYILLNFGDFLAQPTAYLFSRTGFVFIGGLLGAIPVCIWYVKRLKLDMWLLGDIVMPSLAIGHALGRVGCHLAGCCYGGLCEGPWGIRVPAVLYDGDQLWANAFADQFSNGVLAPGAMLSLPLWPVQLFEALGLFVLCVGLILLRPVLARTGMIFGAYLLSYAVLRFGLEFLRGDEVRGLFFGGLVSTSQLLSIGLAIAGVGVLLMRRHAPLASTFERPMADPSAPADPPAEGGVKVLPKTPRRSR